MISVKGITQLMRDISCLFEAICELRDCSEDADTIDRIDYYLNHACMIWDLNTSEEVQMYANTNTK